jgi:hypothetical protein
MSIISKKYIRLLDSFLIDKILGYYWKDMSDYHVWSFKKICLTYLDKVGFKDVLKRQLYFERQRSENEVNNNNTSNPFIDADYHYRLNKLKFRKVLIFDYEAYNSHL